MSHTRRTSTAAILSVSIADAKNLPVKPYCIERRHAEQDGSCRKDKLHGDNVDQKQDKRYDYEK